MLLDPNFAGNRMIYLSFAEDRGNGRAGTSVARAKVDAAGTALEDLQVIFRQEPSYTGPNHWGSRLVFDRTGALFVTLGERFDLRDEAQNPQNHLGKIVRIKPAGGAADDNPTEARLGRRRSGRSAIATCRARPSTRRRASSGPPSTAPAAATRSTSRARA